MYILDKYNIEISIQLDNGIYIFDTESGTGKTRLYRFLRDIMVNKEDVYAVSYDDVVRGEDIIQRIKVINPRLIMIDRYDMYISDSLTGFLNFISSNAIILIDYKGDKDITHKSSIHDEVCFINLQLGKIEVGA